MVKQTLAMLVVLSCACVAVGSEPPANADQKKTQADRERKVKVALALAASKSDTVVTAATGRETAPMPRLVKVVACDWFTEDVKVEAVAKTCPCGPGCTCPPGVCPNCAKPTATVPVAAPITYTIQRQCFVDAYGRKYCQDVYVPAGGK
jgi:hypothetical protein